MTELSREAMQLMELSPVWRLRGSKAEATDAVAPQALMIIALAKEPVAQRLWQAISKTMSQMGYDTAALTGALMLPSLISDRIASELRARQPKTVLVFGQELADAMLSAAGDAMAGIELVALPSLDAMGSAQAKRQMWSMLVAHQKALR